MCKTIWYYSTNIIFVVVNLIQDFKLAQYSDKSYFAQ